MTAGSRKTQYINMEQAPCARASGSRCFTSQALHLDLLATEVVKEWEILQRAECQDWEPPGQQNRITAAPLYAPKVRRKRASGPLSIANSIRANAVCDHYHAKAQGYSDRSSLLILMPIPSAVGLMITGTLGPSWIDKMGLVTEESFATFFGHVFATKEAIAKVPNKVFPFASVTDANWIYIEKVRLTVVLQVRIFGPLDDVKAGKSAFKVVAMFHHPSFWAAFWNYYALESSMQDRCLSR
jgi:hypothetical protein